MRLSRVTLAAVALLLLRCGTSAPPAGSEAHFLASCEQTSSCAQGLICACGVCTKACASSGDCTSLSTSAVCLDVAPICASAGRLCGEPGDASLGAGGGVSAGGKTGSGGSGASGGGSGGSEGIRDAAVDVAAQGSGGSSGGSTAGSGGALGTDSGVPRDAASSGGAGGNGGDGGGVVQDAGPRHHGHLVLIGSSYAQYTQDDERVLENSVFLGGGKSTVRVLEFVQFVKTTTGSSEPDVHPFLTTRANAIGRAVTFTELNDYRWLDAELPGFDVLLVYDQLLLNTSNSPPFTTSFTQTISDTWNPIVTSFLEKGGNVIVLSGAQNGTSWAKTYLIATGNDLLSFPGVSLITPPGTVVSEGKMEIVAPTNPIAVGLDAFYPAANRAYLGFPGAVGGTIVVRDYSTLAPIVIDLEFGLPCRSNLECRPPHSVCHADSGTCVECQTDLECKSPMHCTSGTCTLPRVCSSSLNCTGLIDGRVVCDPSSGECVECVGDSDCNQGKTCTAAHVCATACNANVDCASAGPLLSCDTAQKICVECLDATQCAANQYCELGRCVEDTCVPGVQTCSANAAYQCNGAGDAVTKLTACDIAICTETGSAAVCDQIPDAGSRCPDTCTCPFAAPACCTVDFKCGCVGSSTCQ